jgi:hypothetical protein
MGVEHHPNRGGTTVSKTAIISIGRTTETGTLSYADWKEFRRQVTSLVEYYNHDVYFAGEGIGEFEGQQEESFTIVFKPETYHLYTVTATLATLARDYGQKCVALTLGETEFVIAANKE